MPTFDLYLESGPQHKTTMGHVLSDRMLGCVVNGPTTEQTIDDAPEGIRLFLRPAARRFKGQLFVGGDGDGLAADLTHPLHILLSCSGNLH